MLSDIFHSRSFVGSWNIVSVQFWLLGSVSNDYSRCSSSSFERNASPRRSAATILPVGIQQEVVRGWSRCRTDGTTVVVGLSSRRITWVSTVLPSASTACFQRFRFSSTDTAYTASVFVIAGRNQQPRHLLAAGTHRPRNRSAHRAFLRPRSPYPLCRAG